MSSLHPLAAVRFLLELYTVGVVAAWGLHATTAPLRWLLAAGAALVVLAVWGRFVAPKSPKRLADPARLVVELAVFGAGAAATAAVVSGIGAAVFAGLAVGDAVALRLAGGEQ